MPMTEKDVFMNVRISKRDRAVMAGLARKKDLDSSKLVMSWFRRELKAAKKKAEAAGMTIDTYLRLDKPTNGRKH